MIDPRRDPVLLTRYLLGNPDTGVRGLLDRTERRLGTVTRAQWRSELRVLIAHVRTELTEGRVDPDELLAVIEHLLHRMGTFCSHRLRPVPGYRNEHTGVRKCWDCGLTVTSPIPQDAVCVVCGGACFKDEKRKGNEGKPIEYCCRACVNEAYRFRNPVTDDDLAERRRRRRELKEQRVNA